MTTQQGAGSLEGRNVYSSDGESLGKVEEIHTDRAGHVQYLEVESGWFGGGHHYVPAGDMSWDGDDVRLPYTRAQLESAPTHEGGEHLDYERERSLGTHYGHDVRDWDDGEDRWLTEEDLTRGPTPETRHPEGGVDRDHDTTEGPTPDARIADRAADARYAGREQRRDAHRDDRDRDDRDRDDRDGERVRLRRWVVFERRARV